MNRCHAIEPQLPLLHYGELSADERALVEAHLAACAHCRDVRAGIAATAANLDAAPLASPPERARGLKHAVLDAVECPFEADVLIRSELDPETELTLSEHLEACAPCQEAELAFLGVGGALSTLAAPTLSEAQRATLTESVLVATGATVHEAELETAFPAVGAALDLVPVPMPSSAQFVQLRERILDATNAAPIGAASPAGKVIRFPGAWSTRMLSAAAALLIGLGMGLTYQSLVHPAGGQLQVERQTLASAVANDTTYQVEAIRSYQRASVSAGVQATPEDVLISYEDVIVEFPGTAASLMAIKEASKANGGVISVPYFEVVPNSPQTKQFLDKQLKRNPQALRYDYASMRKLINHRAFIDPRVRQSILLRQAMDAEELSVIARASGEGRKAEKLLANARHHYLSVLRLDPDTKAAFLAREGLRRLI